MENFQFENPVSRYGQHLNREESAQKEQSAGAGVYDAFKLSQNLRAERNSYEPVLTTYIEPLARTMAATMGELWQNEYNGNPYMEKLMIDICRYNKQLEFVLKDNSTKLSFQIAENNGSFYISGINSYDFNSGQSNAPLTEHLKTAVGALLSHNEEHKYLSQNAVSQMYGMLGQNPQQYVSSGQQYQGLVQQNPYQQYHQTPQQAPAYQNQSAPQQPQQSFQQYQQQNVTQTTQNNYSQPNRKEKTNYYIPPRTEQEIQQAPDFIQSGLDRIIPLAKEIYQNIPWKNPGISKTGKPYEMTPNPWVTVCRAIAKEKQGNTWVEKTDDKGNPIYETDKTDSLVYDASISRPVLKLLQKKSKHDRIVIGDEK